MSFLSLEIGKERLNHDMLDFLEDVLNGIGFP